MSLGKDCCGCNACEQLCPKKCITFAEDAEGFMYPHINESECIDCGVCVKHCPIMSKTSEDKTPKVYAAKSLKRDEMFKSSSGGLFPIIAKEILSKGGVVFGCAYDENLTARHISIDDEKDLYRLQSSKYVQSDMSGVYSEVKAELKKDRFVLFSGTGCQTSGLKTFLGKDYPKLYTVDIVCHGVPSPRLFANYIDWMGKKLGGKITEYNFRSKEKRGWDLYYKASNSKKSKSDYGFFDPYYNAFLVGKNYRESCYNCKFANPQRTGDITLADYWGIQKIHPEFYDENGVSLVLVNSEKGEQLWQEIKGEITYIKSSYDKASVMNGNLVAPSERPDCRDSIYEGYNGNFDEYIKTKLSYKINPKTKIKKMIPLSIKKLLKRF